MTPDEENSVNEYPDLPLTEFLRKERERDAENIRQEYIKKSGPLPSVSPKISSKTEGS